MGRYQAPQSSNVWAVFFVLFSYRFPICGTWVTRCPQLLLLHALERTPGRQISLSDDLIRYLEPKRESYGYVVDPNILTEVVRCVSVEAERVRAGIAFRSLQKGTLLSTVQYAHIHPIRLPFLTSTELNDPLN